MKNLFLHPGVRAETQRPVAGGTCHNCQATVSSTFCGACGQKAKVHIASAHDFLHHFVGHYVAAEGKLWRTLGWLIAKPGALTVEYIAGRRGQFIDPLRLLLTMSLLMFLVMRWQVYLLPHTAPAPAPSVATAQPATAAQARMVHAHDGQLFAVFDRASDRFAINYGTFAAQPEPVQAVQFWEAWLRFGPTIMLCLVPLLAAVLKVLHLGTGWRYGEHLVFIMHVQTVTLLALIATTGGMHGPTKLATLSAMALYILLAMRKVYGGGWIVLLLRAGLFGYCLMASFEWLVRFAFLLRMV
ncbi:MAG: hypothetical protein K0R43_4244 [Pseudoduganella sp.]|jgi:hypothetical protein|nr:hypothetical protein [Pseudoduganella sp.]